MRKAAISTALALTLLSSTALADGFSVGASVGSSKIEADDILAGADFSASDLAWKVFAKYGFNDYWAVELGYIDFGNPDDSPGGTSFDVEASGIDAFVIGSIPFSDSFDLFGKAGLIAWDGDVSTPGLPTSGVDGTDFAFGVGAALHATDRLSIIGEWESFNIEDADTVWALTIGIQVGFN